MTPSPKKSATPSPAKPAPAPAAAASSSSSSSSAPATASAAAPPASAVAAQTDYMSTLTALFDEGNLHFAQRQYELAAQMFSQVAEALATEYGTVHPKCADIHFRYGRALLNHAIERAGVLGDAEQVRNATGKREKDLLSVFEAGLVPTKDPSRFHFGDEGDASSAAASSAADDAAIAAAAVAGVADEDEESDDEDNGEEDIEEDDFEIAFEVLDVARVIYEKILAGELALADAADGSPFAAVALPATAVAVEGKGKAKATAASATAADDEAIRLAVRKRYAEVIVTLADVSLESESFGQAVEDYTTALVLQKELYDASDRRLAETHYKLALALEYAEGAELERARDHLAAARAVLVARTDALRATLAANPDDTNARTEIADIAELLPELALKIDDVNHSIHLRDNPDAAAAEEAASSSSSKARIEQAPVQEISNLVKKKSSSSAAAAPAAPAAAAPAAPASPTKKRKHDEVEGKSPSASASASPRKEQADTAAARASSASPKKKAKLE
ncbi:hypothetical protein H9P43_009624 [Blastocladiella emersonii ATCC 22665]|nr:hypothetical protein H9P43_009624 [Blastocladiella emersonii ATCC 22665]